MLFENVTQLARCRQIAVFSVVFSAFNLSYFLLPQHSPQSLGLLSAEMFGEDRSPRTPPLTEFISTVYVSSMALYFVFFQTFARSIVCLSGRLVYQKNTRIILHK